MTGGGLDEPGDGSDEAAHLGRLVALRREWHLSFADDPALSAIVDALDHRGYHGLRMGELIDLSGLGKAEFQRRFHDCSACFQAAYSSLLGDLTRRCAEIEPEESETGSGTRIERWLYVLAEAAEQDARASRILVIEAAHADRSLEDLVRSQLLRRSSDETSAKRLRLAAGAIVEVIRNHLLSGDSGEGRSLARKLIIVARLALPGLCGRESCEVTEPHGQLIDLRAAFRHRRRRDSTTVDRSS